MNETHHLNRKQSRLLVTRVLLGGRLVVRFPPPLSSCHRRLAALLRASFLGLQRRTRSLTLIYDAASP